MSANREKTSNVMGFIVSVLLHGIFFAGCLALDYTHTSDTLATPDQMDMNDKADEGIKSKS